MSCIITLSVSSSVRLDGTIPVSSSASATSSMNSGRCSWRAETLTAIDSGGSRGHSLLHPRGPRAGLVQDVAPDLHDQPGFLEQRHELGRRERCPRSGCSQRASASIPAMSPRSRSMIGW